MFGPAVPYTAAKHKRLLDASSPGGVAFRLAILLLLAGALFVGWREFWFLTDDAFITFRYIDHHRRGWGLSWNPPPFAPVEGYSNFLWAILLEAVWILTGATPPASANVVSLILSYGSLALGFSMVWRMNLPERLHRHRFWLGCLMLLFAVSHRSFITWTSSGLETALFGFCVTLWLFGVLELGRQASCRALMLAAAGAATAALTRPDGLLLVLACPLLAAYVWAGSRRVMRPLVCLSPLLLVLVHLLWRRWYYGAWVPNTYHAKQVVAWPDAGARYTASFILEYAVWLWALVGLVALGRVLWRVHREGAAPGGLASRLPATIAASVMVLHVAYYTFVIGGDHFEYRAYAHLIIPMAVALVRFVIRLPGRPAVAVAVYLLVVAAAQPLPWVHYARTRNINDRGATLKLYVPIADAFPRSPLRKYARKFDALQRWMMPRHVGTRHQEHKVFWLDQIAYYPSRNDGQKVQWQPDHPVVVESTVGVGGWVLPQVAVIDFHGLNDKVVARNPVGEPPAVRLLAHERTPPPGYVDCFLPNVEFKDASLKLKPRKTPLTEQAIRECEAKFGPKR